MRGTMLRVGSRLPTVVLLLTLVAACAGEISDRRQLRVRHEVEWTIDAVVGQVHQDVALSVAFEMVLEEGSGNQLSGTAEGSARLDGTFEDPTLPCSGTQEGSEEYSFEVTGTRDGDSVEVMLPDGLTVPWTVTPVACPATEAFTTPDVAIPYWTAFSGVLADGVYKQETPPESYQIGPGPGTIVYRVEIEEVAASGNQ